MPSFAQPIFRDSSSSILRGAAALLVLSALACSPARTGDPGGTGGGGGSGGAAGSAGAGNNAGDGGVGGLGGFGAGSSTDTSFGGQCAAVDQAAKTGPRPVDIIWAVDTSDSMVAELEAVEANLNSFSSQILNQGIDVHVVVIAKPGNPDDGTIFNPDPGICIDPPLGTGSCPGGSKPPSYQHVEVSVGSRAALTRIIENYPSYKGTLRPNAVKYFSVVTDDDDDMSAADFTNKVNALDPGYFDAWKFFGIFCTGGCGVPLACDNTGDQYNALVGQTGGLAGDLCGGNSSGFPPVFNALAQTVIDSKLLDCEWEIPPPPEGQTFDQGKVNVKYTPSAGGAEMQILNAPTPAQCDPQTGGWYYDDPSSPKKIVACPATCKAIQTDLNAKISIAFGCDTVTVPK